MGSADMQTPRFRCEAVRRASTGGRARREFSKNPGWSVDAGTLAPWPSWAQDFCESDQLARPARRLS